MFTTFDAIYERFIYQIREDNSKGRTMTKIHFVKAGTSLESALKRIQELGYKTTKSDTEVKAFKNILISWDE